MARPTGTAASYRAEYESASSLLPELIRIGDENALKRRIDQANDYNRAITDAKAANREQGRQILARYSTSLDNPETRGLDVARQMRLMERDVSGNREQEQALGAYYNARRGSLADTINAWRTAFQARYGAAEQSANQLREKWQMAFQEEEAAREEAARQAQLALDRERFALEREIANRPEESGPTLGDAVNSAGLSMLRSGATMEATAAQIAADFGQKKSDVLGKLRAIYTPGWELRFYQGAGGARAFIDPRTGRSTIAPQNQRTIVNQLTGGRSPERTRPQRAWDWLTSVR